jgi:hypothetical protein
MGFFVFLAQADGGYSSLVGSSIIFLFIIFFLYIFYAMTLMMIAKRTHTPGAGMAWIPIANLFLMCRIARRPGWWGVMCFIPILNLLFLTMLWMAIAEACGKSIFLGVLAIIPLIGLLVQAYLALTATPAIAAIQTSSNCPSCATPIVPGESFCRQCGQSAPTVVRTVRQTSAGKLALVATGTSLAALVTFGVIGWFSIGSVMAYSPPERKAPEMPERTAGTLTEFPVDNSGDTPTEPGSVIVEDTQNSSGVKTETATQTPQKRLPPGVTRDSLKKRTTNITSVVYRRKPKTTETTPAATPDFEIYICVLRIAPGQTKVGDAMAVDIVKVSGGARTGTRVQSPKGGVYVGSRISNAQTNVYVLEKQNSDILILIYSPASAGNDTAARLAANVGNGEGINDYPSIKNTLWTLPQRPPSLTLIDFYTQTRAEMGLSESDLKKARTDEETGKWIDYFSQFIPESATTARYRDAQGKLWEVGIYNYETPRKAWNFWIFLKWTIGFSSQPITVKGDSALYSNTNEGRILMFQKGMYLIVIKAPNNSAIENLQAVGNSVQV